MAFAAAGLVAIVALFLTGRIPRPVPPGSRSPRPADGRSAGGLAPKPRLIRRGRSPLSACRRRRSSNSRRRPDPAIGAGDRDAGRPGEHRLQLQLDDLRQVVGQRGQSQRQVDQRLLRHHPRARGTRSATAPPAAPRSGRRRRRRSTAPPGRRGRRAVRWPSPPMPNETSAPNDGSAVIRKTVGTSERSPRHLTLDVQPGPGDRGQALVGVPHLVGGLQAQPDTGLVDPVP